MSINNNLSTSYFVQITLAFYVMVLVFGLTTNAILTYILFTRTFMKTKYIFTASISVAHIIMCVLVLPLAIAYYVTNDVNVKIACDVTVSLCVGATTQSMLATSVRRALAISERFRHANFTYCGKVKHVACLWVISLGLAIPYIFNRNVTNLFSIFPPIFSDCHEKYTISSENSFNLTNNKSTAVTTSDNGIPYHLDETNITAIGTQTTNNPINMAFFVYDICLIFLQMIFPITVSLTLQSITLCGIKQRPNQTHWVKEIMICKQHIAVAAIFFICWCPGMVTNIVSLHIDIVEQVYRILHPIGISAILYFPLIYYILNAHIKREVRQWWQGLIPWQQEEANV